MNVTTSVEKQQSDNPPGFDSNLSIPQGRFGVGKFNTITPFLTQSECSLNAVKKNQSEKNLNLRQSEIQKNNESSGSVTVYCGNISKASNYDHSDIVNTLINEQLPKEVVVDDLSKQTMIDALGFAGIDSLDEARNLNLKVIPPGPVLHTWYALYRTGIFDGNNNPKYLEDLNYVQRILDEATFLDQFGIPVIVVYMEKNMPPEELKNMHSHFKNHANVLLISYEQSLNSFKSLDFYLKCDHFGLNEIDDIRFSKCKQFYKFLDIVQQEAKTIKPLVSARIMELGKRSIIYSDID